MNFLTKLIFFFKKPKVIIITGNGRSCAAKAISQVLKENFEIGKKIIIFQTDLKRFEEFKFFVKNSSLPILVATHVGDIPSDKDFFAGEKEETIEIRKLAKIIPAYGYLVLNFDDETIREIKDETNLKEITFGFQAEADFRATDLTLSSERTGWGTNFKINYHGNIVPIWLEKLFGKEQIYTALAAVAVGTIFNLNLVKISEALRDYESLPGKMKLIEGINNSWILDDSESATVFSMAEALEILGKIQGSEFQRKIAVLGDVVGIGKYTIEAHEAIGERAARTADFLFTFGPRAKFIAQGAQNKGMSLEKIFQFDTIEQGQLKLKQEIKEGDLVLVDGSKEMEMGKLVKEIKK